jgi:16S rRNA (cytosine967-C5)-methyltransferase
MALKPERKPPPTPDSGKKAKYDPVRAACVHVLEMVLERGWKTDEAISQVLNASRFSDLDRRFLLQLSHGVIKMKRRLDFTYSLFLQRPDFKMDRLTRNILRLGLYQLIFTDRIPPGAAVSETVNLARGMVHHSRGSFVNAVLRNYLREPNKVVFPDKTAQPDQYLGTFYSYPDWFVKYCIGEFGLERTEKLLAKGNRPPDVTYRLNPLRFSTAELTKLLDRNKIGYQQGKYLADFYHISKQGLPLEKELIDSGRVYVQDESAGLAVKLLDPKSGGHVLDLAAAPGGKATYAATVMENDGLVTAIDVNQHRLETLVENALRLGIHIIAPVLCDMLDFKGPASDRVLLDALCSGWGVVGKHSDLRWSKTKEDSQKLAETQGRLIRHAADLVKPGGVLVYSTCTIIRDENDQVVEEFLLERPDFTIDDPATYVPKELVNERGFVKTYPDGENLDGAFCVRLKKKVGGRTKKS